MGGDGAAAHPVGEAQLLLRRRPRLLLPPRTPFPRYTANPTDTYPLLGFAVIPHPLDRWL